MKNPQSLPLRASIAPELLLLTCCPLGLHKEDSLRQGPPNYPLTHLGGAAELTSELLESFWRPQGFFWILARDAQRLFFLQKMYSPMLNGTTRVVHVLSHCPYGFLAITCIPIVFWVYLT